MIHPMSLITPPWSVHTHCLGVEVITVALGTIVYSLSYVPRKLLNALEAPRPRNP